MKTPWKMTPLTQKQLSHRQFEPKFEDGCIVNDCVPMDDYSTEIQEQLSAASVDFTTLWDSGDMPVLKFDDAFVQWRQTQIEANKILREEQITCTLPWQVLRHLTADRKKSSRLYFSQEARPSCFPFHQKVFTQKGAKTIQELLDEGKEFIVLSYSKRLGRIAAKRAYVYKTGVKPCLRITTDKGVFETTTDHPFMLRTGEFCKASDLQVGMSLFHASTSQKDSNENHSCVRVNICHKGKRRYLHRMIAEDVLGWNCDDTVIHHIDGNALNNEPSNLELVPRSEHAAFHAAQDAQKRLPSLQTAEYRDKMRRNMNRILTETPPETRQKWQLRSNQERMKKVGYHLINNGYDILTFDTWFEAYRTEKKWLKPHQKTEYKIRIEKYFGSYQHYLEALKCDNHRIISIEAIGEMEVASIGVIDPEPDDKRPWSEHNFMICPLDCDDFSVNGILVANCMGHADAFAHHSTKLQFIARGAPLIYVSFNPIVTWAITKGGSMNGGQTVSEMAKGANVIGHFAEFLVGTDNQRIPEYEPHLEEAKRYQSAILFLDFKTGKLADEIIKCCSAGLSVALGNSAAVSGSTIDKNGVKVATIRGTWAHATHFTAYRVVNGVEYIGWVNSHGNRYPSSDEGEPADMCWMTRAMVEQFIATAHLYGPPYVTFPESLIVEDSSLYVRFSIPFPDNWRF